MVNKFIAMALTGLVLTGCDSYTSPQYQVNPANVIALQSIAASGKKASVGTITTAEGVNPAPTCRLAGPLDLGGGQDVKVSIKQALQAEFLAGKLYSNRGTPINVSLTKLKGDSFSGKWTIGLAVSSRKGRSYNVETVHKFKTSFTAGAACNNTADAFNRALAKSINSMIKNPLFRSHL